MRNWSKKHIAAIVSLAIEIVAIIFVYFLVLKDLSLVICLAIFIAVINYLVFSIFDIYALERFKEQLFFKLIISIICTFVFYLVFFITLKNSNKLTSENGITEMGWFEILINLLPNLFLTLACFMNFMSNRLRFFIIKTVAFFIISILTIIASFSSEGNFLANLIFLVLLIIQTLSAVILSVFKKE